MTDAYLISLGMYVCAFVILGILFVAALLGRKFKEQIFRWFFYVVLLSLFGIISEAFTGFLQGIPGEAIYITIKIADFLTYTFGALGISAGAMYLYEYIKLKTDISKTPIYVVFAFSGATIVLAAIAQFNDQFIWLDANNYYHTGSYFWITYIFWILSLIIYIGVTLRHIKDLTPREWIVLLLYMAVPIACYAVEFSIEGLWVAQFGAACTLLLIYITLQVYMMQKITSQDAELAEGRISIMLSQIKPHFLYNSLTAISDLCEKNPEASKALLTFSKYLRGNLDSLTMKDLIPFESEMEHVRQYLWLEQLRFEERLQVEYDMQTIEFMLPPLTVQPIVENAVLHGVVERRKGGMVRIRTDETADCYRITVSDDGVGFDSALPRQDERSHTGIENVRARLKAMCGGTLDIESLPGKGTTATIEIPKKEGGST